MQQEKIKEQNEKDLIKDKQMFQEGFNFKCLKNDGTVVYLINKPLTSKPFQQILDLRLYKWGV